MLKVIIIIGVVVFLCPLYACLVAGKKADEEMSVLLSGNKEKQGSEE